MSFNRQAYPIKILIAEDNIDHADIMIEAFNEVSTGNEITHLTDGQKVINYLESSNESELPDLVLTDIKMPLKTGFDILKHIKDSERLRRIPVIIISTTSNEQEKKIAYQLGAVSFVQKPIMFQEFTETIKAINYYWTLVAKLPNKD